MIKVLVVETTVFGYDGITNVIINYYKYIDYNKIQMDLLTINPVNEKFQNELIKNGNRNYVLPYRNRNPIKYISHLCSILKKGNYQIIHVHGCSATMAVEMLAAKLAGVRVRICHSHNTRCDHAMVDRLLRPLFNRLCNVGFACGKEAGEWLFQNKNFQIITNGINLDKFQFNKTIRKEFRDKYGLNDKFVIGHVGRFSEQKNHGKLIDIYKTYSKLYNDAILVLIGDGELQTHIKNRVKEEKLNVLFVGVSDEVEKWLQAIDVIVFPSLFEGLPLGLIEAQAAGLPCILSNTVSPMTKITDFVEFLPLEENEKKWAEAIAKYRTYDRSREMPNSKRQIIEVGYDIRDNALKLYKFYRHFLNKLGG